MKPHGEPEDNRWSDDSRTACRLSRLDEIGGHGGMLVGSKLVYKPLQEGKKGERELLFYQWVAKEQQRGTRTGRFFPHFHGLARVDKRSETVVSFLAAARVVTLHVGTASLEDEAIQPSDECFLVLDDLTAAYRLPCVMDVKVGTKTWGPDALPPKIAKERKKYPPQAITGFRYTGMLLYRRERSTAAAPSQDWTPVRHPRSFGHAIDENAMPRGLNEFLDNGECIRRDVALHFLATVDRIHRWMTSQSTWQFFGSSLLCVYDAYREGLCAPRIHMIDFAHAWRMTGPTARDYGYIHGLENIMRTLAHVGYGRIGPLRLPGPCDAKAVGEETEWGEVERVKQEELRPTRDLDADVEVAVGW